MPVFAGRHLEDGKDLARRLTLRPYGRVPVLQYHFSRCCAIIGTSLERAGRLFSQPPRKHRLPTVSRVQDNCKQLLASRQSLWLRWIRAYGPGEPAGR